MQHLCQPEPDPGCAPCGGARTPGLRDGPAQADMQPGRPLPQAERQLVVADDGEGASEGAESSEGDGSEPQQGSAGSAEDRSMPDAQEGVEDVASDTDEEPAAPPPLCAQGWHQRSVPQKCPCQHAADCACCLLPDLLTGGAAAR